MKMLLFNHPYSDYSKAGLPRTAHGIAGREWNLGKCFAGLGWTAELLGTCEAAKGDGLDTTIPGLRIVNVDTVKSEDYDVVIFLEHCAWTYLRNWKETGEHFAATKLLDHPWIIAFAEGLEYNRCQFIADKSKLVVITSYLNISPWREWFGYDPPLLHLPWAAPHDLPRGMPSPYETDRKRIVFTGNMNKRFVDRVNDIAKWFDGEIWIAALFIDLLRNNPELQDPSLGEYDKTIALSEETRQKIFPYPNVRFISEKRPSVFNGIGPAMYGEFWDFLEHADMAIGFTTTPGMRNSHDKTWDYLAYGLPIIFEEGSTYNEMIVSQGGLLPEWNNPKSWRRCIELTLEHEHDREETIRFIQDNHTWPIRVAKWDRRIRELEG